MSQGRCLVAKVRLDGTNDTKERFQRYMETNPATRQGWVSVENVEDYQVTEDYLSPFREVAANFGLVVEELLQADESGEAFDRAT